MRRLLAIGSFLALMVLGVACSDDHVPSYVAPVPTVMDKPAPAPAQPEPEPSSLPETAPEPQSTPEPAAEEHEAETEAVSELTFTLTTELPVYHYPDRGYRPIRIYETGETVVITGRAETPGGETWLRVDRTGEESGWTAIEDSPLTPEQVRVLPELRVPSLPKRFLRGPRDGTGIPVRLVGVSADGNSLVVRVSGSNVNLWIDGGFARWDLPTYEGPVAGALDQQQSFFQHRVELIVDWLAGLSQWPGGPTLPLNLLHGEYPVLGRTLDSDWVAIRLSDFSDPVFWIRVAGRDVNIDIASLPVFLSDRVQVVTFDSEGRVGSSLIASKFAVHWEWRSDSEVLLSHPSDGTWLWNVTTDEYRWITDRVISNISPDGRYASELIELKDKSTNYWSGPWRIAIVSLEDGRAIEFDAVHDPGLPCAGKDLEPYWSADSRWLLTEFSRPREEGPTRYFAQSVDGERVEILPDWNGLCGWETIEELEAAGRDVGYLNSLGEPISKPWVGDQSFADPTNRQWDTPTANGWEYDHHSADGRYFVAHRVVHTDGFDAEGIATLPPSSTKFRGWYYREIGMFDAEGTLLQSFRGKGAARCNSSSVYSVWSPGESRMMLGLRSTVCGAE